MSGVEQVVFWKKITDGTFWSGDRWVGRKFLTAKIEKVGDGGNEK